MCGIAMIVGTDPSADRLADMVGRAASRGLVTETSTQPGLVAATRRLPIVDRDHAVQPWNFGPGGCFTLVYNGELYNHATLRTTLRTEGCTFTTESDTEVIAAAFEKWGEEAVSRFEGEFAFAVASDNEVYMARDPFGVKPLYYAIADRCVHVASEIKSLVGLGARIVEVPAGQHGWISCRRGANLSPHFNLRHRALSGRQSQYSAEGAATHDVREAVTQAIECRVQTDLPLALVLSGGIDSSIVATVAARTHPDCVAFTIGTPDSPDIEYASRLASELGVRHEIVTVAPREITRTEILSAVEVSELTEYGDIINAVISRRLFAAIGAAGFRVAIGGDCSDELFGGYPMYDQVPADQRDELFLHKLANLSRTELQRVDRTSMAETVEMRVPFLDQRVVDVALRLPINMKVRAGVEKWVVRQAFADQLPDYITARPKHGLSYSSGLHDRVRLYKPFMAKAYRRNRYGAHAPLRRDFDYALAKANNDFHQARDRGLLLDDHTAREHVRDLAGAIRWNVWARARTSHR